MSCHEHPPEFYSFIFEGTKAIDPQLFSRDRVLNYLANPSVLWITLIDIELARCTFSTKRYSLYQLRQGCYLIYSWEDYETPTVCYSPKITASGLLKTSCAFPRHYPRGPTKAAIQENNTLLFPHKKTKKSHLSVWKPDKKAVVWKPLKVSSG